VIDAMTGALRDGVSNLGGGYGASDDAARITSGARGSAAELIHGDAPEISFGQNMTSLTLAMSRALAMTWSEDDTIVLTSLDHDANYTPWVLAARDSGAKVRVAVARDRAPRPSSVVDLIDESVRLVAVCLASNALGTVVDVAAISDAAHQMGARVFVDAVHAGPHLLIDVSRLGCDFLVASSYTFFGPHTGLLYGRREHMATLEAYKVRPAPTDPPGKWETGTQSFESLAGVSAAIGYLASLGEGQGRDALSSALAAITRHETSLGQRFLDGIEDMSHVMLYGPPEMGASRVATFAIDVEGMRPDDVAARMIEAGIYVWSGHYYAVNAMDRLGVLEQGGLVRIGFVHYNTFEEVDRVLEVLANLAP
jgi:cysteine desulfurase family protein (TIGR01976 family)